MFTDILHGFFGSLAYVVLALVLLLVYKAIHDLITPFDDSEELKHGNWAAAFTRNGAYLGVVVAASGSLIRSDSYSFGMNLLIFALDGFIAIIVFTAACYAFDWIIIRHINNAELIQQGNVAVGVIEASAYLSLGLIVSASFSGSGQSLIAGLVSAVVFSVVGVITLVVIYAAYCALWRRFSCDIDALVGQGDLAAAIDAGSLLLAMSITLWFSISGDFTGWGNDFLSYGLALTSSTLVVPLGRLLASKLLAHGLSTSKAGFYHGNVAKSLTVGLVSIGMGFVAGLVTFI